MDFLKKHYETVALGVALLAMIATSVAFAMRLASQRAQLAEVPSRLVGKGEVVEPTELGGYTNALASLRQPPLWVKVPVDPFGTTPREAPIVTPIITNGEQPPVPIRLLEVKREPFKLLFKSYTGEGANFQLNFQFRARTFFVAGVGDPVGDRFENTGYRVTKFEQKSVEIMDPSLRIPRTVDVSELTIQHEGEDPITLVVGKEALQREPVATIRCGAGTQTLPVRRGQRFDCAGNAYIVVDISARQMIIVDQRSEEKHIIDLIPAR